MAQPLEDVMTDVGSYKPQKLPRIPTLLYQQPKVLTSSGGIPFGTVM